MHDAACLGPVAPLTARELKSFADDFNRARHIDKLWEYYVGRGRAGGVLPADWQL